MCKSRLSSLLLFSLLLQSDEIVRRLNDGSLEFAQKTDQPNKKLSDNKCDFTAYDPVRGSHFVARAIVKKHKPIYPAEAVSRGIQGFVNVQILINRNGDVERACALDGDELLKSIAEESALQWKFKPNFGASSSAKAGLRKYMIDVIGFNFVLDKAIKVKSDSITIVRPND